MTGAAVPVTIQKLSWNATQVVLHSLEPLVNTQVSLGDCAADGVSGPTRRAEVRRDGHCE